MTSVELRPATQADSARCHLLHRAAMRAYVEAIWGWDEHDQQAFHDRGFDPTTPASLLSTVTTPAC